MIISPSPRGRQQRCPSHLLYTPLYYLRQPDEKQFILWSPTHSRERRCTEPGQPISRLQASKRLKLGVSRRHLGTTATPRRRLRFTRHSTGVSRSRPSSGQLPQLLRQGYVRSLRPGRRLVPSPTGAVAGQPGSVPSPTFEGC